MYNIIYTCTDRRLRRGGRGAGAAGVVEEAHGELHRQRRRHPCRVGDTELEKL